MPWRECCKMDERLWISSATDTRNNVARRCQANPRGHRVLRKNPLAGALHRL